MKTVQGQDRHEPEGHSQCHRSPPEGQHSRAASTPSPVWKQPSLWLLRRGLDCFHLDLYVFKQCEGFSFELWSFDSLVFSSVSQFLPPRLVTLGSLQLSGFSFMTAQIRTRFPENHVFLFLGWVPILPEHTAKYLCRERGAASNPHASESTWTDPVGPKCRCKVSSEGIPPLSKSPFIW